MAIVGDVEHDNVEGFRRAVGQREMYTIQDGFLHLVIGSCHVTV